MKRTILFMAILALATMSIKAQDSVFSHTHQGTTLFYIVDSTGDAMLVAPIWPEYDEASDESWLGYAKPQGDVVVPDSVPFGGTMHPVTRVGHDALYHCDSVTSVTLPEAVTSIGYYAFGKCYSLTTFSIPEGVTDIPSHCFYADTMLAQVTIPNSVTHISPSAFQYCYSLLVYTFRAAWAPSAIGPSTSAAVSPSSSLAKVWTPSAMPLSANVSVCGT